MEEQWAHERAVWKAQDRAWTKESKKYERMFSSPKSRRRKSRRSSSSSHSSSSGSGSALTSPLFYFMLSSLVGVILMGAAAKGDWLALIFCILSFSITVEIFLYLLRKEFPLIPISTKSEMPAYAVDAPEPEPERVLTPSHQLSPLEFEKEVALVLEQLRPVKAKLVGGMGDGGIDIELYDLETQTRRVIVQCKRYAPNKAVPPSELRDLDSCRRRTGVRQALLVTTGRFSDQTRQDAKSWGIDLMDGAKFEEARMAAYRKLYPPASVQIPSDPIQDQLDERRERLGL